VGKKELKEMILSLGNIIKEFAVYSGEVGDSLSGHIDKMIDSEAMDDFLKIKNDIILEADNIKEDTQSLKGELEKYKEKTIELTKRLEETEAEAFMDSLTGVYNRNAYNSEIIFFVKKIEKYKDPFGIIVLDIDHFKKVNDTYGHAKGDDIL
jgi:PleD family two-component response regulator|tara:strand:+ start:134 stop:589 length:456 start_codon:yes stop_codon:yes gene_type:complete